MFENKTNFYYPEGVDYPDFPAPGSPVEPLPITEPVTLRTRKQKYLAKIAGADVTVPEPRIREEYYLAAIAGEDVLIPEPKTADEYCLCAIAEGGGGKPSGTKTITQNGMYDVTDYANVEVDVSASNKWFGKIIINNTCTKTTSFQIEYMSPDSYNLCISTLKNGQSITIEVPTYLTSKREHHSWGYFRILQAYGDISIEAGPNTYLKSLQESSAEYICRATGSQDYGDAVVNITDAEVK